MGDRQYDIIHAKWPEPKASIDVEAKAEIEFLVEMISAVRGARSEYSLPWSEKLLLNIAEPTPEIERRLFNNAGIFVRMTKTFITRMGTADYDVNPDEAIYVTVADNNSWMGKENIQLVVAGTTVMLSVPEGFSLDAERIRITKAIEAATKERDALAGRLSNAAFVEKAKPEAVEKARADHAEKAAEAERLQAALARLG